MTPYIQKNWLSWLTPVPKALIIFYDNVNLLWHKGTLIVSHHYDPERVIKEYIHLMIWRHCFPKNLLPVAIWQRLSIYTFEYTFRFLSTQTDGIYYFVFMSDLFRWTRMHLMREMVTQTKQVIFEHISLTQQESTKKSDPLLGFFNIYIYNNTHLFIHSDDSVGII